MTRRKHTAAAKKRPDWKDVDATMKQIQAFAVEKNIPLKYTFNSMRLPSGGASCPCTALFQRVPIALRALQLTRRGVLQRLLARMLRARPCPSFRSSRAL
mmetsp:Transcript_39390/g.98647  ORF Transcript_39390/g.98647 Transcript_39390/m.98647 type:complete len:100 (+) Transcript_39390:628-927(+)